MATTASQHTRRIRQDHSNKVEQSYHPPQTLYDKPTILSRQTDRGTLQEWNLDTGVYSTKSVMIDLNLD